MYPASFAAFSGAAIVWLAAGSLTAQGDAEHAKLKNPVLSTPDSIAAGKALFTKTCAPCHGVNATGGSGNDISPPSPDLTDTEWQHGGSDGESLQHLGGNAGSDRGRSAKAKDDDVGTSVNIEENSEEVKGECRGTSTDVLASGFGSPGI